MKSYKAPAAILFLLSLIVCGDIHSQVGINTTNPRTTLEVAGDALISGTIEIGNYNALSDDEDSTFLIQDNLDEIKSVDVSNPTGEALAYVQEYIITNPDEDWVFDFDTGVDANDFVLIVISSYFNLELNTSSSSGAEDNASLPYTATFIKGGTWHIIADYPMVANLDPAEIGTWTLSTLIFSRDLSKQLGSIDIPMSNATSGSASSPIIN
ncbi:hypothetical protein J1N09_06390 [Aureitalea sp. L0-47]|uniref:hypothetical protein n=1 Tax=Aureitalea sp. L0-47 TaxID=2816962 RepID=UPI002237CF77|nr:hypothetical protein [Aureitalea sp. L0-47]MCW5519458.1 hypothetical protein [Aureitalea sp. L0-47]